MARKGGDFELAYEWLYELDEKYTVTCPAYVLIKRQMKTEKLMCWLNIWILKDSIEKLQLNAETEAMLKM